MLARQVCFITAIMCFPAFAHAGGFKGLWIDVGIKAPKQSSVSKVSYDYMDKYAGRTTWPGFVVSSSYELNVKKEQVFPSIRLLYAFSIRSLLLGVSVSVDQPLTSLSSEKFDFSSPTGWPDRPRGYSMTTEVQPSFDLGYSIEPGIELSTSVAAFLKLSYHQMNAGVSTKTSIETGLNSPAITESAMDQVFRGVGAGIGLRILYSENAFIEPLVEHVVFQPEKTPGSTIVSPADEVTITQSQEISLRWTAFSLSVGGRF